MSLIRQLQKAGVALSDEAITAKLAEYGYGDESVLDAAKVAALAAKLSGGKLAIAPTPAQTSPTSTRGRKLAKTANKNDQPIAPVQSVELQKAIDSGKEDLHTHFDALNQIGLQVASAKVEMSRAMPQIIAQKVDELLAANPIDTDAGARRVREAMMSESIQAMLTDMGLEFSYE